MKAVVVTNTSFHECKMFDGNKPHVGGPATEGSSLLYINGQSVSRQGDELFCASPNKDKVMETGVGRLYVDGKPVALKGDRSLHGGEIIEAGNTLVFVE